MRQLTVRWRVCGIRTPVVCDDTARIASTWSGWPARPRSASIGSIDVSGRMGPAPAVIAGGVSSSGHRFRVAVANHAGDRTVNRERIGEIRI